jgi:hypothetical protein
MSISALRERIENRFVQEEPAPFPSFLIIPSFDPIYGHSILPRGLDELLLPIKNETTLNTLI